MNLKEIAARVQAKQPVTPDEFAYLITNDRAAFFAFLIANNPGSMNHILRHKLGYSHELGWSPDPKKIQRICQIILERNNLEEIQTILNSFALNPAGLSPKLIKAIKSIQ
ncbi:MAG: hypothetical protein K0R26_1912 [Bacteroidota bacterium]|jgi:hypothetical protein|nr:hypothetical protein [Bacteroidota bacterium]